MKEFKMTIDDWSVLMNQQDQIKRMLKWIIIKQILSGKNDFIKRMLEIPKIDTEQLGLVQKRRDKILDQLPSINDIVEE